METLDKKHDKKHTDTNAAISALELKINTAVESFTNIAATNATAMHETGEAAILSARAATEPIAPHVPNDPYTTGPLILHDLNYLPCSR